jgi:hypothetical protein
VCPRGRARARCLGAGAPAALTIRAWAGGIAAPRRPGTSNDTPSTPFPSSPSRRAAQLYRIHGDTIVINDAFRQIEIFTPDSDHVATHDLSHGSVQGVFRDGRFLLSSRIPMAPERFIQQKLVPSGAP